MIVSIEFDPFVKKALVTYGVDEVDVQYVEKLPMGDSPFIPACTCPNAANGIQTIYLLNKIDDQVISASKAFMPRFIADSLKTEEQYFQHTVLHEICHILFGHDNSKFKDRIENELIADKWAYEHLPTNELLKNNGL